MKNNPVTWFEIYVNDMDRAKKFYETIFANEMTVMVVPEGMNCKMTAFPYVEGSPNTTGALVQSSDIKAGGNSTLVYFETEDCLAEQNRVEQAGGKVVAPKFAIGQYGFCTLCIDTEGNMFGLHSMK
ncbi:MAG: VOC family protein [Ignavibacteria bacterium]